MEMDTSARHILYDAILRRNVFLCNIFQQCRFIPQRPHWRSPLAANTKKLISQCEIFIADDGTVFEKSQIIASPRIGVDYAGEDAGLLYRFYIKDNPFVSGKK